MQDLLAFLQPKVLAGQHVLVTAGPTYEAIDPVRGITNLSSGKMGFAIARAAREAGAVVTLVAGPVHLQTPRGVHRLDVRSALEMQAAVALHVDAASVFVATAAVADWRVADVAGQKIKKDGSGQLPQLSFVENPDILAGVAQSGRAKSGALYCVGRGLQRVTQNACRSGGRPLRAQWHQALHHQRPPCGCIHADGAHRRSGRRRCFVFHCSV